jgi:pectate disaccharide-lyase
MNLRDYPIPSSSEGCRASRGRFYAVASLLLAFLSSAVAADYYVAPSGSDANPGTQAAPFATIPKAISVVSAGDNIYLRGGTHAYSSTITIAKAGTSSAPIKLRAFPGEKPVLNFSTQPYGAANRGILFSTTASWWHFLDLEIAYAGDNGVKVEGSHARFERCVFHHNGDTGLQIGFGHTDSNPGGQLAAFIDVIDCDSYRNYDPDNRGSDADGFAAKMHCGQGIVFSGCRAWENSDDGWDLFETDYSVVIDNCWTWHNGDGALFPGSGSFQGNGNGFKLGGDGTGGPSLGIHYLLFSVSFNNKFKSNGQGITNNSHRDGLVINNCLAFANGSSAYNYFIEGGVNSGKTNRLTNCVSFPRTGSTTNVSLDNDVISQNCSWTLPVTANESDFGDLSEAAAGAPRQADGSLPAGFARLVASSDLIDKGVNVGYPFAGAAPDLGPDEFAGSSIPPPAAPSGLTATATSSSQINLAWTDNSSNENGFTIERSTGGGAFATVTTVAANVTTYQNTGLAASTAYTFRVRASNGGGSSAYSNTATATTQPVSTLPPAAPTSLTATATSSSQINLAWTDNANNETAYSVERATGGGAFAVVATLSANATAYQSTGLAASTTYSFRVRASNSAGNSAYSNTAIATTPAVTQPPAAPTGLTAAAGNAQVGLSWTASSGAASYNIKRATVSSGPYTSVGTATSASFTNTGLTNGTTYYYVVSAVNAAGESPNSAQVSGIPSAPSGNTLTLFALPTEDGRVLESSEGSNSGGSTNSADATIEALRTGDDASDRQFKSVLSFDTSGIPDGATIVSATLRIRRGSLTGTNPFTTHGSLFVDIKGGTGFSGSATLQTGDFSAAADAAQVATMSAANANGDVSSGALNASGRGFINKTGKTQLRVYFSLDDNDDMGADYLGWYSGNDATAANRPVLEVTYQ